MSEQNKDLVIEVLEAALRGDVDAVTSHPGMAEVLPMMKLTSEISDINSITYDDVIAEGNWVALRITVDATATQDYQDVVVGDRGKFEIIGMYCIEDGSIVEQHSQGGRI